MTRGGKKNNYSYYPIHELDKMRRFICLIISIIIVTFFKFGFIENSTTNSRRHSSAVESISLPLQYCTSKYNRNKNARIECFNIWQRKYKRYCQYPRTYRRGKCAFVKREMKNALSSWKKMKANNIKTNRSLECRHGRRSRWFDPVYQFCCYGHIRKKKLNKNTVCCTTQSFPGAKCCNKSHIQLDSLKIASCCMDKLFDADVNTCLDGRVYPNDRKSLYKDYETFHISYNGSTHKDLNEKVELKKNAQNKTEDNITLHIILGSAVLIVMCIVFQVYMILRCLRKVAIKRSECYCIEMTAQNNMMNPDVLDDSRKNMKNTKAIANRRGLAIDSDINSMSSHTNTVSVQTEGEKSLNIRNSMGEDFTIRHKFDSNHKILQLQNSSVKLTLSDEDARSGTIECFASTFTSLCSVYDKLEHVLEENEAICSAAIEYVFPDNIHLEEYACVEMAIAKNGSDFRVWKIRSGQSPVTQRYEIPKKECVDLADKSVDSWYELCEHGKVRVYMKTFCWLVCTVCNEEHYGFGLTAKVYTKPEIRSSNQLHVTMYILDDLQQLPDYAQSINEDERNLKIVRNVALPMRVKLEDQLRIHLMLLNDSDDEWDRIINTEVESIVEVHQTTKCHNHRSPMQPFAIDWYFERRPDAPSNGPFVFQCLITSAVIPAYPGLNQSIPESRFLVTHEDNLSVLKKVPLVRESRLVDQYNLNNFIQQPVSAMNHMDHNASYGHEQQSLQTENTGLSEARNDEIYPTDTEESMADEAALDKPNFADGDMISMQAMAVNPEGIKDSQEKADDRSDVIFGTRPEKKDLPRLDIPVIPVRSYEHLGARPRVPTEKKKIKNREEISH